MIILTQPHIKQALNRQSVKLAYLFGSVARGEAHQESDVDIAILFDKSLNPKNYLLTEGRLIELFSPLFPGKEINLVNLNVSSPLLKQNVILEGRLFFKANEIDRIMFEIKTLKLYEEYRHLNKIYQEVLKSKIEKL